MITRERCCRKPPHARARFRASPHRAALHGAPARHFASIYAAWQRAGIAELVAALAPSQHAVRYQATGGKRTWLDGPFAESKELVAGFSILGDNQVDIRVVQ